MSLYKLKQITILSLSTGLLILFQNCGQQVAFQESSESINLKNGDLTLIDDSNTSSRDNGVAPDDDDSAPVKDDGNTKDEPAPTIVCVRAPCEPARKKPEGKEHKPEEHTKEEKSKEEDSSNYYRCVVAGPGKSRHIGFLSDKASIDINTPDTLCMSRSACLDIMSTAFDVKQVQFTGYCKNDKAHTIRITDAQAADLVAELMAK